MTHPTDDELQDLAHSAYEEALSFGLSVDTFLRYFKGIRNRLAQPPVAPPAPGGDVQMALARMDALLDPERNLLSVSPDSATAQGCRNDMLTIRRALAALQSTAAQGQDAAPAEQPQTVELLDERGEIRRDLKSSAYCVGNEYKPFHPSASHVRPEWRDGWNACFVAAIRAARAKE